MTFEQQNIISQAGPEQDWFYLGYASYWDGHGKKIQPENPFAEPDYILDPEVIGTAPEDMVSWLTLGFQSAENEYLDIVLKFHAKPNLPPSIKKKPNHYTEPKAPAEDLEEAFEDALAQEDLEEAFEEEDDFDIEDEL